MSRFFSSSTRKKRSYPACLFFFPHVRFTQVEKLNAPFARAVNEEAALQSFVLLKNSVLARTGKPSLPLSLTTIKTIAIVGPHADYARGLGE